MICRSLRLKPLSSSSWVMEDLKGENGRPKGSNCCNSSTCWKNSNSGFLKELVVRPLVSGAVL